MFYVGHKSIFWFHGDGWSILIGLGDTWQLVHLVESGVVARNQLVTIEK